MSEVTEHRGWPRSPFGCWVRVRLLLSRKQRQVGDVVDHGQTEGPGAPPRGSRLRRLPN